MTLPPRLKPRAEWTVEEIFQHLADGTVPENPAYTAALAGIEVDEEPPPAPHPFDRDAADDGPSVAELVNQRQRPQPGWSRAPQEEKP